MFGSVSACGSIMHRPMGDHMLSAVKRLGLNEGSSRINTCISDALLSAATLKQGTGPTAKPGVSLLVAMSRHLVEAPGEDFQHGATD